MNINIKKLHPDAIIPSLAHEGDAGMDLVAISEEIVIDEKGTFGYISYDTGLAIEIPLGYVGMLFPRSSISKTGLILANSVGIVDSGYRGSVSMRFKWISRTAKYNVGDRIGQLIIMPLLPGITFNVVEELSNSERGGGGYGSTGS